MKVRNAEMEKFVDEGKIDDVVIHIKMPFDPDEVQIQLNQEDQDVLLKLELIDHF